MSKYKGMYKCLMCGRVFPIPKRDPKEFPEEKINGVVAFLADSTKHHEEARKYWPYVVVHDCWGNGQNIGAAVFAGVIRVDEKKGRDNESVSRE